MTRKTTTKLVVVLIVIGALGGGGFAAYNLYTAQEIATVQAGEVVRQDLAQSVAANGEIKPKKSVNISSNAMGRIVSMPVREGVHVKEGDLLISLESIQTAADVESAQSSLAAAENELKGMSTQIRANEAAIAASRVDITRAQLEIDRAKQDLDRSEKTFKDGLISRELYDRTKSTYDLAVTGLASARTRLQQAEAQAEQTLNQRESTEMRLTQQRTQLIRAKDQFSKTTITAPLTGVITYLPVNEGEIAIVGLQNQPGTTLMTIADMSVITAEVRVDEADIVNVKVGQEAEIKVDALSDQKLKGHVSEVGNTALNRSGQASNNSGQQEAKDFKVVITLDAPPDTLRPGLSCTVTIITARIEKVLTIPIQALTVREFDDPADPLKKKKIEKEGVYTITGDTVLFKVVKTGIKGTTDIEILEGLSEKDKIVTGPYQVLRTLEDNKKIKIEEEETAAN